MSCIIPDNLPCHKRADSRRLVPPLVSPASAANNARAMASTPTTGGYNSQELSQVKPVNDPSRTERGEAPLFHFGLRQLFWFTALICTLLAGVVSTEGAASLGLLMAAMVVAAHVFSTGLGSRLRSDTDRSVAAEFTRVPWDSRGFGKHRRNYPFQRVHRSPWHDRGSTALPWLPGLVLAGVLLGGITGAAILTLAVGHRISAAGVVVGSVSTAVLGGWFTFLGGSFYGIFRHGLRDALAEPHHEDSQQRGRP